MSAPVYSYGKVSITKSSFHVLVVDDDEQIRETVQEILELLGYCVDVASSGEECLSVLEHRGLPNLVILDLTMPGLSGVELLPILRSTYPDLPVVLETGRLDSVTTDLLAKYPEVSPLKKPFTYEQLREEVETVAGHGLLLIRKGK